MLGALALVTGLSGCWLQPGVDAGHSNWNTTENRITADNVDQLRVEREFKIGCTGCPLTFGAARGDKVFLVQGNTVVALNPTNGLAHWLRELPPEPNVTRTLAAPVIFHDELLVGVSDTALSFVSGDVLRLDLDTGAVLGSARSGPALDVAFAGDTLAVRSIAKTSSLGDYVTWIDWKYRPALPLTSTSGEAGDFAIVGDRVAWSLGSDAVGYDTTCDPNPGGELCLPVWQTDLGAAPTAVAAIGTDRVAYIAAGTLHVLDAATGDPVWSMGGAFSMAVAGDTLVVSKLDATVVALPVDGCGTAACAPLWSGPSRPAKIVLAGDVAYLSASNVIRAFALDGCGTPTCEPLTTLDAAPVLDIFIVDNGRVVASNVNADIAVFGLPS
jgi:hypothetical protein